MQARRAARLGEVGGFAGAPVYSDNNSVDPWVIAQEMLSATDRFASLAALHQFTSIHSPQPRRSLSTADYRPRAIDSEERDYNGIHAAFNRAPSLTAQARLPAA